AARPRAATSGTRPQLASRDRIWVSSLASLAARRWLPPSGNARPLHRSPGKLTSAAVLARTARTGLPGVPGVVPIQGRAPRPHQLMPDQLLAIPLDHHLPAPPLSDTPVCRARGSPWGRHELQGGEARSPRSLPDAGSPPTRP
ncbi:MAG: hypothetical protein ACRDX8_02895, partial [Acidimicrobiales bacterium]